MHSCEEDIDYQMSLNSLTSYWDMPSNLTFFTPLVFAAVEKKRQFGGKRTLKPNTMNYSHTI